MFEGTPPKTLMTWLIIAGLVYFIFPFDLIPDFLGIPGRVDDVALIGFLTWFYRNHLKQFMQDQARAKAAGSSSGENSSHSSPGPGQRPRALDAYTVSVDMMSAGTGCNGMGMGFAEDESGRMLLVQWMDPNDDNGWYSPGGHIRLAEYTGSWSVIQDASWYEEYTVDFVEWATLSVEVDGSDIRIYLDDELVMRHEYTGTLVGPGRVSVWTWDADNGVYFDNVQVTQP